MKQHLMEETEIKNRVVSKMLRKRVTGTKKQQIDTVVEYSVPSNAEGRAKDLIEEMATDPTGPIERYGGGHRTNIRLTSPSDAVEFLKANDGDVPFGFD